MKEIISIETVLNSRCSCDLDGDSKKNHWGKFVDEKYLSKEVMEHLIHYCKKAPQFSNKKLSFWFEDKYLFLGFEKTPDHFATRVLHIESGMQHEAVYLACTALGVGACIHNLGVNGTEYGNKIATASFLILENAESYNEGRFTTAPPGPEKPFRRGKNLPEPRRNNNVECLSALEQLTLFCNDGADADENDISQMLWAARGRTPHYIKSHPWGLTIPTWGGRQNYTTVYLVKENKLFRYINWTTRLFRFWWIFGKPTHDIKFLKDVEISTQLEGAGSAIILSRNEKTNRAIWEVGYMLENMLLQAKGLGLSFKSKVFMKDDIGSLERNGISEGIAALLF